VFRRGRYVSTPDLSTAILYEFSRQAGESAQSAAVAATNRALKLGLQEKLYYRLSSTIHGILLAAARGPAAVEQFGSLAHRQSDKFRLSIASAAGRAASRCEALEGL